MECPITLIQAGPTVQDLPFKNLFFAAEDLSENQIMKKIMTMLVMWIVIFALACSKNNDASFTTDCSGEAKSYAADVSSLIQTYCATAGCHASGSTNGPGALTTYAQVYNARSAIRSSVANGSMPENTTLSSAQKNNILCWIDNGALNN